MARKMAYTSQTLLHKKFSKNVKGYDPLEVDRTLDDVIEDYRAYEKYYEDAQAYIRELETKYNEVKEQNKSLITDLTIYKNRLEGIGDDKDISKSNIDLKKRMRKLEIALYQKGVDPSKIQ